jgi:hypothetical protein
MRRLRHAFALAWLALAGTATAATAGSEPALAAKPVRLAAPHHGGSLRQVIAKDAAGLATGQSVAPAETWKLALETEDSVLDPSARLAGRSAPLPKLRPIVPTPHGHAGWPAPIPILLLTQRQNE